MPPQLWEPECFGSSEPLQPKAIKLYSPLTQKPLSPEGLKPSSPQALRFLNPRAFKP